MEKKVDIDKKLNTYLNITDIINNAFGPQKPSKKARIKLHSTLTLPDLLCGGENWTINPYATNVIYIWSTYS